MDRGTAFLLLRTNSTESCTSCHTRPRRGLLANFLIAVVVRKLSIRQTLFPLHAKGDHTCSQHVLKDFIHTLNLPTVLRVICGTEHHCRTNRLLKGLPKLGGEKTASIRVDLLGNAVQ